MNIRFVVFDAVGTVMYPTPGVADTYQAAMVRHCGLELPADQIRDAVNSALRQRSEEDSLRTDEAAEYQFWHQLIDQLCAGHSGQQACFEDLYSRFQQPDSWKCFDDVAACLAELRAAELGIAIASNFDQRLHRVLDGLPPLSEIDHRFVSSEIGWRKPAEPFFDHVCERLNASPDEVLFVGDDLQNDVFGARRAGCATAWIRRNLADKEPVPDGTLALSALTEIPLLMFGKSLS